MTIVRYEKRYTLKTPKNADRRQLIFFMIMHLHIEQELPGNGWKHTAGADLTPSEYHFSIPISHAQSILTKNPKNDSMIGLRPKTASFMARHR